MLRFAASNISVFKLPQILYAPGTYCCQVSQVKSSREYSSQLRGTKKIFLL